MIASCCPVFASSSKGVKTQNPVQIATRGLQNALPPLNQRSQPSQRTVLPFKKTLHLMEHWTASQPTSATCLVILAMPTLVHHLFPARKVRRQLFSPVNQLWCLSLGETRRCRRWRSTPPPPTLADCPYLPSMDSTPITPSTMLTTAMSSFAGDRPTLTCVSSSCRTSLGLLSVQT